MSQVGSAALESGSPGPRRQPPSEIAPADPCALVIFGAAGDLTQRLVAPALYNLARAGTLPQNFALIGVDLAGGTAESWAERLRASLERFVGATDAEFHIDAIDEPAWRRLAGAMSYVQGDLSAPDVYAKIRDALTKAEAAHQTRGNVVFYLAVADRFFGPVVDELARAKLTDQPEDAAGAARFWRRVVIEKPFGHDLASAQALNARILRSLREDQIFRIDHFLGKDTVQNILALRFANGLFEPIWNRDRIDHVQITVSETVGVEARGKFYEATGALRDMIPNHLFALLSLLAMEPPTGFDAAAVRSKKAEVFAAMPSARAGSAVRGQYGAGDVLGRAMKPYREEPNVDAASKVETFVAMQLEIDNWRWAGVPFYLRTGKHLSRRRTEIAVCFKQAPYAPFKDSPVSGLTPNWLVLSIAPDEGVSLQFEAKRPGLEMALAAVEMEFRYDDWFAPASNVGYETLLYDVMIGDPTLFMRADMVEAAWRIVQPVLEAWTAETPSFPNYASGSDGPRAADELIARGGGRAWRPLVAGADGKRS